MKRIVEHHLARLRRTQSDPAALERQRDALFAHLYPEPRSEPRLVRQQRIPAAAPDWQFESELRRSGLWDMMERCYPTALSQSQ